jgi:hypothetical protein
MEYLQGEVKKIQLQRGESVKEVVLTLDVKTRWNSIISMLDSVLKVNFCIIFFYVLQQDIKKYNKDNIFVLCSVAELVNLCAAQTSYLQMN